MIWKGAPWRLSGPLPFSLSIPLRVKRAKTSSENMMVTASSSVIVGAICSLWPVSMSPIIHLQTDAEAAGFGAVCVCMCERQVFHTPPPCSLFFYAVLNFPVTGKPHSHPASLTHIQFTSLHLVAAYPHRFFKMQD